jgi:general secretion pathway protein M
MSVTLSPPLARLVAISLLLVVLFLGYAALIAPLLEAWREARGAIADAQGALLRMADAPESLAARRQMLADLQQRQRAAEGLLQGDSETLIAAQLQNRIKTLVDAAQGEVTSMQVLQTRNDGGFRKIAVRGQVLVGLPGLQKVLYELEAGVPYLFLDNVEIRVQQSPSRVRDEPKRDPPHDVRFDLYGFARGTS